MSEFVAVCLLRNVSLKGLRQVATGLISNAGEYPEYIDEFVCQMLLGDVIRGLRALIPIGSSDNARHLAHLLSQLGHICEW